MVRPNIFSVLEYNYYINKGNGLMRREFTLISKKHWHIKDEWKRHLALAKYKQLKKYIPPTQLLTTNNLENYLHRYHVVFIKPVFGSFGNNILKVTRQKTSYKLQHENKMQQISQNKIVDRLLLHYQGRRYMIQKGISMEKLQGSPIDFRILLLRPKNTWITMGIMGKKAERQKFVTNFSHGGKPIRFDESLRKIGWHPTEISQVHNQMNRIGLFVANKFIRKYKHCRKLGIDIALDTKRKIWILEVNTNPTFELFRSHEDKQLYNKIGRYVNHIEKQQSD